MADIRDVGLLDKPSVVQPVPFFHKGPAKAWKFPTNNCRSEEMATKASFRDAVRSRR